MGVEVESIGFEFARDHAFERVGKAFLDLVFHATFGGVVEQERHQAKREQGGILELLLQPRCRGIDFLFAGFHVEEQEHQTAVFRAASTLNELRRQAVAQLQEVRVIQHLAHRGTSPSLEERRQNTTPYFEPTLDYRANIINEQSSQFYQRHGANTTEYGLEKSLDYQGKALMTTKYCLRYELGCCLKTDRLKWRVGNPEAYQGNLYLQNARNRFALTFDCTNCQMLIKTCGSHKT